MLVAWFRLGFGWEEVRWSREEFRVGPRGGARVGAKRGWPGHVLMELRYKGVQQEFWEEEKEMRRGDGGCRGGTNFPCAWQGLHKGGKVFEFSKTR
jgi:hypothetical protein